MANQSPESTSKQGSPEIVDILSFKADQISGQDIKAFFNNFKEAAGISKKEKPGDKPWWAVFSTSINDLKKLIDKRNKTKENKTTQNQAIQRIGAYLQLLARAQSEILENPNLTRDQSKTLRDLHTLNTGGSPLLVKEKKQEAGADEPASKPVTARAEAQTEKPKASEGESEAQATKATEDEKKGSSLSLLESLSNAYEEYQTAKSSLVESFEFNQEDYETGALDRDTYMSDLKSQSLNLSLMIDLMKYLKEQGVITAEGYRMEVEWLTQQAETIRNELERIQEASPTDQKESPEASGKTDGEKPAEEPPKETTETTETKKGTEEDVSALIAQIKTSGSPEEIAAVKEKLRAFLVRQAKQIQDGDFTIEDFKANTERISDALKSIRDNAETYLKQNIKLSPDEKKNVKVSIAFESHEMQDLIKKADEGVNEGQDISKFMPDARRAYETEERKRAPAPPKSPDSEPAEEASSTETARAGAEVPPSEKEEERIARVTRFIFNKQNPDELRVGMTTILDNLETEYTEKGRVINVEGYVSVLNLLLRTLTSKEMSALRNKGDAWSKVIDEVKTQINNKKKAISPQSYERKTQEGVPTPTTPHVLTERRSEPVPEEFAGRFNASNFEIDDPLPSEVDSQKGDKSFADLWNEAQSGRMEGIRKPGFERRLQSPDAFTKHLSRIRTKWGQEGDYMPALDKERVEEEMNSPPDSINYVSINYVIESTLEDASRLEETAKSMSQRLKKVLDEKDDNAIKINNAFRRSRQIRTKLQNWLEGGVEFTDKDHEQLAQFQKELESMYEAVEALRRTYLKNDPPLLMTGDDSDHLRTSLEKAYPGGRIESDASYYERAIVFYQNEIASLQQNDALTADEQAALTQSSDLLNAIVPRLKSVNEREMSPAYLELQVDMSDRLATAKSKINTIRGRLKLSPIAFKHPQESVRFRDAGAAGELSERFQPYMREIEALEGGLLSLLRAKARAQWASEGEGESVKLSAMSVAADDESDMPSFGDDEVSLPPAFVDQMNEFRNIFYNLSSKVSLTSEDEALLSDTQSRLRDIRKNINQEREKTGLKFIPETSFSKGTGVAGEKTTPTGPPEGEPWGVTTYPELPLLQNYYDQVNSCEGRYRYLLQEQEDNAALAEKREKHVNPPLEFLEQMNAYRARLLELDEQKSLTTEDKQWLEELRNHLELIHHNIKQRFATPAGEPPKPAMPPSPPSGIPTAPDMSAILRYRDESMSRAEQMKRETPWSKEDLDRFVRNKVYPDIHQGGENLGRMTGVETPRTSPFAPETPFDYLQTRKEEIKEDAKEKGILPWLDRMAGKYDKLGKGKKRAIAAVLLAGGITAAVAGGLTAAPLSTLLYGLARAKTFLGTYADLRHRQLKEKSWTKNILGTKRGTAVAASFLTALIAPELIGGLAGLIAGTDTAKAVGDTVKETGRIIAASPAGEACRTWIGVIHDSIVNVDSGSGGVVTGGAPQPDTPSASAPAPDGVSGAEPSAPPASPGADTSPVPAETPKETKESWWDKIKSRDAEVVSQIPEYPEPPDPAASVTAPDVSAPSSPDVLTSIPTDPNFYNHMTATGDNLWNINKENLDSVFSAESMTPAQKVYALDVMDDLLRHNFGEGNGDQYGFRKPFTADDIRGMGITSGNPDQLKAGEVLNLEPIYNREFLTNVINLAKANA